MVSKKCVAMILAGGQGSRLGVLTKTVAKPAVPFGGKYRIIDFPLSNCIHSGIDTVGVLTQYQPLELNTYIGNGNPWDLDRSMGGAYVLPPYQSGASGEWYKGTANAIYQNIGFMEGFNPENVLILSGDHIYKMHYGKMLEAHIKNDAAVTIAVMPVPWEEASRFGIMNADDEGIITEFEEKPAEPKSNLASMGVYIFKYDVLKEYKLTHIPIIGLAKEFEEIFVPNSSFPIIIPHDNEGLQLLQRVRDESHRFAITYHRQLRAKKMEESPLDNIAGVGKKRKMALLKEFKDIDHIRDASIEDLAGVKGMNEKVASNVYEYFHNESND